MNIDTKDYKVLVNDEKKKTNCKLNNRDSITTFKYSSNREKYGKKINLMINGEEKSFTYDKKEFIFVDIFNHIDFDLSEPKGRLILKVNGREAKYMEPLKELDNIEVYWDSK